VFVVFELESPGWLKVLSFFIYLLAL
jgi:hypothetical protein